jgi:DNA-binding SARP family transcriptional activator
MTRHLAPAHPATTGLGRTATGLAAGLLALVALAALIVGPPWALLHYVGSPLPHTLPDRHQLSTLLTQPLDGQRLVHLLAVLCWIAWAIFVLDTARSITTAPGTIQADDLQSWQPIRRLTAMLVGTIALTLVGHRSTSTATAFVAEPTHPAHQPTPAATAHATHPAEPGTVTVQEPCDGIHDSLWRIAQRSLGDGNRWPEIYHLNHGRPQPDGRALSSPSLIQPGWVLQLPANHAPTVKPEPPARSVPTPPDANPPGLPPPHQRPAPPGSAPSPRPTHETPPSNAPAHPTSPAQAPTHHRQPSGIDLGDGIYLSAALAAALSAALLARRRRNRRTYIPGSGRRDDIPVAPVVRSLHLAHLRDHAQRSDQDIAIATANNRGDHALTPTVGEVDVPVQSIRVTTTPERTVEDLLVAARGLGMVGPGAGDAARALLLERLAAANSAEVFISQADADDLLGPVADYPAQLHVLPSLPAVLDELEATLIQAARRESDDSDDNSRHGTRLLIARTPPDPRRLQAILDSGARLGIQALLLGQWRAGASAYILADGTVSATDPGPGKPLRGSRLFTAPISDTAQILRTLGTDSPPQTSMPKSAAPTVALEDPVADTRMDRPAVTATSLTRSTPTVADQPTIDSETFGQPERRPESAATATTPAKPAPSPTNAANTRHEHHALTLSILGPPQLRQHANATDSADITARVTPRQLELLVLLALHPDGITRDLLAATLWPDTPRERPFSTLNTSLARLRTAISQATDGRISDFTVQHANRYTLDHDLVGVDYWHLAEALTVSRTATGEAERDTARRDIVAAYRGELAEGLSADWIETPRQALRRDALDAATHLARLVVNDDAQQALSLFETARGFDPYNEQLYQDIMRLQRRLGRPDAIGRTLELATTRLAEIDESPSPDTIALAARLQLIRVSDSANSRR